MFNPSQTSVRGKILFSALTAAIFIAGLVQCTPSPAKPNLVVKDAPQPGKVAKIGDTFITEEELIGAERVQYLDLQKKLYEFRMKRLNEMITEKLVGAEAAKKKMPIAEYIDKEIVKNKAKPSEKEYKDFVVQRKIPDSQITPQLKTRIEDFLKETKKQEIIQAHLGSITKNNPVEVYFRKPKMDVQVNTAGAPRWGKADAPVTIVEFSDFQCPFCSQAAETVKQMKKDFGSKITVVYKHFPLSFHPEARPAAEASMCVHDQKNDKFWDYYDKLFKNQKELKAESLEKYAKEVGMSLDKFKECLTSGKFRSKIDTDIAEGEKLGIRSTPTFLINGDLVSGALPPKEFKEAINEALTSKN